MIHNTVKLLLEVGGQRFTGEIRQQVFWYDF